MTRFRLTRKIAPAFSLDIELHPAAGITAIYGPSGAGKTVLLELIAGLIAPDSGRILLDEAILYDAGTRVTLPPGRRGFGYISQRDSLFPHMTLRQNVAFAAQQYPRLDRVRRVSEMLERCVLVDVADLRPDDVEAERRFACTVARALIGAPKLLLVDDAGVSEVRLRFIRGLFTGPILLVTADLDLCCAAAEEMIVLDRGRIAQRGAPRQVLAQPDSVEVARILGFPNLWQGTITALDPGRNQSRLEFTDFALSTRYLPGHFKGDRVWVAAHAHRLRAQPPGPTASANALRLPLVHVSERTETVRLEFAGSVFVDLTHEEFRSQRDNKEWQVDFPRESLLIL
jgi:molybdate transport system ATP-binding protein